MYFVFYEAFEHSNSITFSRSLEIFIQLKFFNLSFLIKSKVKRVYWRPGDFIVQEINIKDKVIKLSTQVIW